MKRLAVFSMAGLLLLAACTQKTEVQEPGAATPPVKDDRAAIAAGQQVYDMSCAGCHDSGTGGAPKPGDKEDWKARIALGIDVLTKKSIEGYEGKTGTMPARGGNQELSDTEVANAVLYMVDKSK